MKGMAKDLVKTAVWAAADTAKATIVASMEAVALRGGC